MNAIVHQLLLGTDEQNYRRLKAFVFQESRLPNFVGYVVLSCLEECISGPRKRERNQCVHLFSNNALNLSDFISFFHQLTEYFC